jgi:hypothetical protein
VSLTELIGLAIGCTLMAIGLTSIGAWALRRRATARLLFVFGIWCLLYGVRLLAREPAVQLAIGGAHGTWSSLIAFITYGINVPTALFFEALVGPGWRQSVRRVRQVQVAYAVVAIGLGLATGNPNAAMPVNNGLVLACLAIEAWNVWRYRDRLGHVFGTAVIGAGGLILMLAVINENTGRLFVPDINLEPVGVLAFVAGLGYGVVVTAVRGETELLAVQRELQTARDIQRSLLPRRTPRVPGLDVAVHFVPMTAVGGDVYDFVDLGPTRTGILVADVSGHGIPAALVASMVKLAFSIAVEREDDPARVMSAVNQALCRQLERSFVTAAYVVVDTERSTLTAVNAGHPPVVIGSRTRGLAEMREHGLMLGFMPEADYVSAEIALQDGDTILLYTDGVIEARNASGEFFDAQRVARWATSADGNSAAQLRDSAVAEIDRWRGRLPVEDDLTLVVARYRS